MRLAPLHPRQLLPIALATVALMLTVMIAATPELGTLDWSIGSGERTASPPAMTTGEPSWVSDPLAPPVEQLRAP